jgi:hypothetical protein
VLPPSTLDAPQSGRTTEVNIVRSQDVTMGGGDTDSRIFGMTYRDFKDSITLKIKRL